MFQQISTILIGMIGGVSVGVQTPIANAIGRRIGSANSSVVVHITGAIFSLLLLFTRRDEALSDIRKLPAWMYIVGMFGLILYLTVNHTIPRIGVGAAVSLIIVGQLVSSMLIDHFGWLGVETRPIDGYRLLAVGLLLAGGYLMSR